MHGLINRSIQCFVQDSYGAELWQEACHAADLGFDNFEAMLIYEDDTTARILGAVCGQLGRSQDEFLEDLGTYLVSHPNLDRIRRLLRFGGDTFEEFLHSLDDLRDRARLALPDLDFPSLELQAKGGGSYDLKFIWEKPGFAPVALGVLRAMADDYGALVFVDHETQQKQGAEIVVISLTLLEAQFAKGREFLLGGPP